jgi:thiamine transporter ThiT
MRNEEGAAVAIYSISSISTFILKRYLLASVVMVIVLDIGPKVRGFKTAEDDGFLRP